MENANAKTAKCIVLVLAICLIGVLIWYRIPVKLLDVDPDSVAYITIFDGNTGRQVQVTDAGLIRRIVENLDSVTLRRGKVSIGYTGYRFRTEVCTRSGDGVKLAARFIINTAGSVRKDPFFYRVEGGELDFDFIQSLFS